MSHIDIDWRANPDLDSKVRKFFSTRKLFPAEDYLAGNGNVSDALRCLHYRLQVDADHVATLIKDYLREVYGLQETAALDFFFEE